MKKFLVFFLLCVFSVVATERTFLRPRSVVEDTSLFLGMNNFRIYQEMMDVPIITDHKIERHENYFFHGGIFFDNSLKPNEVRKYFFPNGFVTSQDTQTNEIQNYLFCPKRQLIGIFLNYHQDFCQNENLWVDARSAIYRAKHTFLLECSNNCTKDVDFLNGLNVEHISTKPLKKTGIDDIEVKLGYTVYKSCNYSDYFNLYGSVLIPTASKPKGEFLFEPLVGRSHWALGAGLNGGVKIFHKDEDERYIALMADLSYQYLFAANECRLVKTRSSCQELSTQYLNSLNSLSRTIDSTLGEIPPAINSKINFIKATVLNNDLARLQTTKLSVTPGSCVNLWIAMHYLHTSWNIEFGYNLWWKDTEKVRLAGPKSCGVQKCTTQDKNLDLKAAANPGALTNKIYLLMGYFATEAKHIIPFYAAASYEFSRDKNALEQWEVWFGADFSF